MNSLITCSTFWRVGNSILVCVFKSETDRQTYRQAAPLTRAGGHTPVVAVVETICYDLLEEHVGLSVNPMLQIKITGRIKLQNPSALLSFPASKLHFLFDDHKTSLRTALPVCTIYDNTFSPCFHLTTDISTILPQAIVHVTQSTQSRVVGQLSLSVSNTECFH